MILINYFARYREQLNLGGEKLPLTDSLQANDPGVGAVVSFVGYVRDINQGEAVSRRALGR